jgi:ribosomal protein S18 acetylase RimI-like enzyme
MVETPGLARQIAPCLAADLPRLFGLAMAAFGAEPGWSDDRAVAVLRSATVFVARDGRRPVGYVALRRLADDTILVEQLLVAPGCEHRGVGRALLGYAEGHAIAEGATALRMVVEETNLIARDFYARRGFVAVGREAFELTLPRRT